MSVASPADFEAFLDVPYAIYANDPHWIAPLRSSVAKELAPTAPFRRYGDLQAFLARRGGRPVGRIVASINHRLNKKENRDIGLFGYFECEDNPDTARALLHAAESWVMERGCTIGRGPINLSTHVGCLFQVDGFGSDPVLMMPYNPPYYPKLVEAAGWAKLKDAYAYDFPMPKLSRAFERAYRRAVNAGVSFRPIRNRGPGFEEDVRNLHAVFSKSFTDNWSATPRTEDEFWSEAQDLRQIADTALFPLAFHEGHLVGFWMGLPDINIALKAARGRLNTVGVLKFLWNRRKVDRARVLAVGVLPEYQDRRWALGPALVYLGMKGGSDRPRPYKGAELSWVWEDNDRSRHLIEGSGGTRYKTYRIYERTLGPG